MHSNNKAIKHLRGGFMILIIYFYWTLYYNKTHAIKVEWNWVAGIKFKMNGFFIFGKSRNKCCVQVPHYNSLSMLL